MQLRSDILPALRVLANRRYGLDVYQRGYVWSDRELSQFLTDLEDYAIDWGADPAAPPWFLGSVIVEKRAERSFLVDGQQRLVTLSLLLAALHGRADRARRRDIELVLGRDVRGLPVAVGRYQIAFSALASGAVDDVRPEWDDDQRRIAQAYLSIQDWLAAASDATDISALAEAVMRRCFFNVVTVTETELAYRLFNSLNARGKPLTTLEALKGVLFADLNEDERAALARRWDEARADAEHAGANATLDALRAGLIARHAPPEAFTPDAARRGDVRVIRDNPFEWLTAQDAARPPADQVGAELPFHLRLYARLADAARVPTGGAEAAHFVTETGVALASWAPVVMAPLVPRHGDPTDNARKAAAALAFVDIAAARAAWRPGWLSPAALRDRLLAVTPELRGLEPEPLAYRLGALLEERFEKPIQAHPKLHIGAGGLSQRTARVLLARLSAQVEVLASAPKGDYAVFARDGEDGFAVERLIAARAPQARDSLNGADDFESLRDLLGVLVLAPSAMVRDLERASFSRKAARYGEARNTLAMLMAPGFPDDPLLATSLSGVGAKLGPYPDGLKREDVVARQAGYAALAGETWRASRIMEAAADPNPRLVALLAFAADA